MNGIAGYLLWMSEGNQDASGSGLDEAAASDFWELPVLELADSDRRIGESRGVPLG